MTSPISNQNQEFAHDSVKYVYQDPNANIIHKGLPGNKPFRLEKTEKSSKPKKDLKKNKHQRKDQNNPYVPKIT